MARSHVVLLTVLLGGLLSQAARAEKAAAAPAVAELKADMAAPYFQGGLAGKAAAKFALEEWGAARDGFAAYLKKHRGSAQEKARVRLLIAVADSQLGQWSRAAAGFAQASGQLSLISDYIHYQAARAYYFAGDMQSAMKHARKVAIDSIVGADAQLLIGDIHRSKQDHKAVAEHYGAYVHSPPRRLRMSEARFRLAEAYEALGRPVPQAIELYRTVLIHDPLSSWATKSQARFDALTAKMSAEDRKRYQTFNADELITRAMVYYDAMRNPVSAGEFEKAMSAPGITDASLCLAAYHRANSWFKERDRKQAAPIFDEAFAACKKAKNIDLQIKAAYQAGRSYAHLGEHKTAIDRYQQAESVDPSHSFADDARLRQAEEWAELKDEAMVTSVLASIPKKYPVGDMRAEAMWRLGWRAYQDGKYSDAIGWLKQQIEVMPIDNNFWAEGQAQYWLGRSYAKLKNNTQAVAAYRDAIMRYPLSYYALLAFNRLRESYPAEYEAIVKEIGSRPAQRDMYALSFKPRPEYASPGFARAIEFMRLGLGGPAEAELGRLGLSHPGDKKEVTDPDKIEKLWAGAFLYDRAGRYEKSHWPTRWHILDYRRTWPTGENYLRWRIAYPKGFWDLLSEHAALHGFPTELLIAIVREESAFNPLLESYANAIGLTQMIMPTARRFSSGTGIQVNRQSLRDPEKNVTIGSRFLAFLWNKWQQHIMLVPPSYNAGEGAVARWLRERGHLDADEWVESIKADQPRGYTKRVLGSYFVYAYLNRGEIPVLSNAIPGRKT